MIVITFDAKKKWKKKLNPKKLYSIKEASKVLGEAEIYAQDHQLNGSVEYSVLNEDELLFRDTHTIGVGQSTNILFLVRNALNTTFKSSPEAEKNRLLELLTVALRAGEGELPSPVFQNKKKGLIKQADQQDSEALQKGEMKEHKRKMKGEKRKKAQSKKAEKQLLAKQKAIRKTGIQSEKRRRATLEKKRRFFEQQKEELLAREQQEAEVIQLEKDAMAEKKQLMAKEELSEKQFREELERLEAEHTVSLEHAQQRIESIQKERKQLELDGPEGEKMEVSPMPGRRLDLNDMSKKEIAQEVLFRCLILVKACAIRGYKLAKVANERRIERKKRKEEASNKKLDSELELQNIKKDLLLEMKKEQKNEQAQMKAELREKNKEIEAFNRKQERYKKELARSNHSRRGSSAFVKFIVCLILAAAGMYFFQSHNGYHILSQWKDVVGW